MKNQIEEKLDIKTKHLMISHSGSFILAFTNRHLESIYLFQLRIWGF